MFAEGRALGEERLQIAEEVAHPESLMIASLGLGMLAMREGDLPRALSLLERAMDICHEADLLTYFPHIAAALGAAYTLGGRVADAVPLLTLAMAQASAVEGVVYQALCRLALGEAQLRDSRVEEAQALALARARQERSIQAYALCLLSEMAARREPPESSKAEEYYHLVAHCHRGLGRLYAITSQYDQARAALSAAIDLYRTMEMTFWLPEVEAVLV
jgi:tetratricopeptide (TPR) repeat protein